jgi:hypothetical protein
MATLTKQYLDKEGLDALWRKIDDTFSPRSLAYRPTVLGGDATSLTIQFKNANDEQTNIILPLVNSVDSMKPHAGLMSPSDKDKLDSLDSTAENAVTLKNILVGGGDNNVNPVKLTPNTTQTDASKDDYKSVAFGLSYDADSDLLSIVDLNTQVKDDNGNITTPATALSSVHILGDALKDAMIEKVEVVNSDGANDGLFLKFTFKTITQEGTVSNTGNTRIVYVNIADLVDIYTGGIGISIDNNKSSNAGADYTRRSTVINLKTADTNEIGGIKVHKNNTEVEVSALTSDTSENINDTSHRYLGVEIDKNGQAFVYNPVEVVDIADASTSTDNTNHGGTFTAMTGLTEDVDKTTGNITLQPTITTYTLPSETTLSKGDEAAATTHELKFGDTFTVMTDTTVDNHTITDVNTEFKLPVETVLTTSVDETISNDVVSVSSSNTVEDDDADPKVEPKMTVTLEFETLDEITVENHAIKQHRKKHTATIDIESIPVYYINSLQLSTEL